MKRKILLRPPRSLLAGIALLGLLGGAAFTVASYLHLARPHHCPLQGPGRAEACLHCTQILTAQAEPVVPAALPGPGPGEYLEPQPARRSSLSRPGKPLARSPPFPVT